MSTEQLVLTDSDTQEALIMCQKPLRALHSLPHLVMTQALYDKPCDQFHSAVGKPPQRSKKLAQRYINGV